MKTTRPGQVKLPSRRVRAELPVRVVIFLRAAGTNPQVRYAMRDGGYTEKDHAQGLELLARVCAYQNNGPDPRLDEPARRARALIAEYVSDHTDRLRAAVERLHPEHADLFSALSSPKLKDPVLTLAKLLERLARLEKEAGGKAVLKTLAQRSLDRAERQRLSALLQTAKAAAEPVSENKAEREAHAEALLSLYSFYRDWAATARALVKRRDLLVAMGLAGKRKSLKSPSV